jgi:hypothetical protein
MFQVLTEKIENIYDEEKEDIINSESYKKLENDNLSELKENLIEEKNSVENSFNNNFNIELRVANDETFRPKLPKKILNEKKYSEIIKLMEKCWVHKSTDRPNFNEITFTLQEIIENCKE